MADIKPEVKPTEEQQNFAIQTLLQQTQDKFQTMSEQIITRIDEMGNRIDDLEKNISDLMTQAGVEGAEK
ncbi:heat shock factor-binding protein 1-like isoform X2 [Macrosteles quadrilineatus]|uniref:heat shock factor-binding protein 1-like isoform X2 n=1 Tax=Macrosteles quadrilineatus TaxID=74068 RepID=UPI0023E25EF7|nr:heat shock factor-binding protein 1-like isoform X2 [Macrosteles quadrilineatus]